MIFFIFIAILFRVIFGPLDAQSIQQTSANVLATNPVQATQVTLENSQKLQQVFTVEVARTYAELERGLMYRTSMAQDHGMLFVFHDEQPRTFWMKNTLIPLDMIFTTKDGMIVKIWHDVPPCHITAKSPTCAVYASGKPAAYVLEINGGLAQKMALKEGDRMVL